MLIVHTYKHTHIHTYTHIHRVLVRRRTNHITELKKLDFAATVEQNKGAEPSGNERNSAHLNSDHGSGQIDFGAILREM